MGFGFVPTHPITGGASAMPEAVLDWIQRAVPSFPGAYSFEYTGEVIARLRKQGIPGPVIVQAMVMAESLGYDFVTKGGLMRPGDLLRELRDRVPHLRIENNAPRMGKA